MSLTVDASVFMSANRANEITHLDSFELIRRIDSENILIVCPSIVLTESATAISRISGKFQLAHNLLSDIRSIASLDLVSITEDFARRAAVLGANLKLRGADSIYVQCAIDSGSTLITWDNEMLARAPSTIQTMTPVDWLAANA